jgi:hypothetical protein
VASQIKKRGNLDFFLKVKRVFQIFADIILYIKLSENYDILDASNSIIRIKDR